MPDAPTAPVPPYGTELRLKRTIPFVGIGVAVVFAAATVALALGALDGLSGPARVALVAVVGLGLVIAPAVSSFVLLRRRVFLGRDGVHVTTGEDLVMTLRWADLEQVRASWASPWTSWRWFQQPQVLLAGRPSAGRRAGKPSRLLVGARMHAGFGDLVAALQPEVERRPDVVPTEHHREVLENFVWLYVEHDAVPE